MNTSQQPATHADQAREHLTQKVREDINAYWPTTPSWELADHFQRAIRTDAAAAVGHALLALHEDLAGLRDDLANGRTHSALQRAEWLSATIAAADRRDARVATVIAAEMATLRREVTALNKGLADIATAVRELAAAQQKPRRRWLGRCREEFNAAYDQTISDGGAK